MGYYISLQSSDFRVKAEHLDAAYEAMCALNTDGTPKRGGSYTGGAQTAAWFSWMDANYPETCKDAAAILEMLGFEVEVEDNGDLYLANYDSKTGQEDVFLERIAPFCEGTLYWRGEDGEQWAHRAEDGKLKSVNATVTYDW